MASSTPSAAIMPTPHIREARRQDKAAWLKMRRALWPQCPNYKHRLEISQLLKSRGVVFIAENGRRQPVGFAELSLRCDHVDGASTSPVPYLEAWFVNPSSRKQGVGRALINAVERWAIARA